MHPRAPHTLFDPALWRLEVARRRLQLQEMDAYVAQSEAAFQSLQAQVQAFLQRYEAALGEGWREVEALQTELQWALERMARACGLSGLRGPQRRAALGLPVLPAAPQRPAEPTDDTRAPPLSLKALHRRAAMRLHPDRASDSATRVQREALMRDANLAYANQDRVALEALLLAAGETPALLGGFDVHAHWRWLDHCEAQAQARLRVVRAHLMLLRQHPSTVLAEAVEAAQRRGLDALPVMAARLRAQARELRQQLYIGQRLPPDGELAQRFLGQWRERWEESASVRPVYAPVARNGVRAASSAS